MTPVVASLELPKVELCSSDENPAHYSTFVHQFELAEVRAAIEECVALPSPVAYKRAREILGDLYGKPPIVARSLLEGLFSQARQTTHMAKSIADLHIKMKCCEIALMPMNYTMRNQWAEVTDRISAGRRDRYFADLTEEGEARNRQNPSNTNVQHQRHEGSTAFLAVSGARSGPQSCFICSQTRGVVSCPRLLSMSITYRWNCICEHKACFVGLDNTHFAKVCRCRELCDQFGCTKRHHALVHVVLSENDQRVCALTRIAYVPSRLEGYSHQVSNTGWKRRNLRILDSGSDVTLIKRELLVKN
ncbi:unnamed protein product [Schistocephalus solidus]|uniref:Peptidase A2 domain-containing protein n=1 Tax=Schistocephalus solidus TaxID=70667 RepID=A0A183SJS9_SCHSO|nr:unnamed protein product [Schistocephalus solidus]